MTPSSVSSAEESPRRVAGPRIWLRRDWIRVDWNGRRWEYDLKRFTADGIEVQRDEVPAQVRSLMSELIKKGDRNE